MFGSRIGGNTHHGMTAQDHPHVELVRPQVIGQSLQDGWWQIQCGQTQGFPQTAGIGAQVVQAGLCQVHIHPAHRRLQWNWQVTPFCLDALAGGE
jgi:hypothetical protein